MTKYEKALIQTLRQDAKDVKDCYTRFSFQAIAFGAAVLGIIARYQPEYPLVALASIAVILLLAAVARIGTYKYASANRHFGYELHLFRTRNMPDSHSDGWKASMREIGWEEAMRAWRVVQATVFRHLYYWGYIPNFLRWKHRKAEYHWFNPGKLASFPASYHAGNYLRTMNTVLHSLAGLALIPLYFMVVQLYPSWAFSWKWE